MWVCRYSSRILSTKNLAGPRGYPSDPQMYRQATQGQRLNIFFHKSFRADWPEGMPPETAFWGRVPIKYVRTCMPTCFSIIMYYNLQVEMNEQDQPNWDTERGILVVLPGYLDKYQFYKGSHFVWGMSKHAKWCETPKGSQSNILTPLGS
jgi:hypothetical protein